MMTTVDPTEPRSGCKTATFYDLTIIDDLCYTQEQRSTALREGRIHRAGKHWRGGGACPAHRGPPTPTAPCLGVPTLLGRTPQRTPGTAGTGACRSLASPPPGRGPGHPSSATTRTPGSRYLPLVPHRRCPSRGPGPGGSHDLPIAVLCERRHPHNANRRAALLSSTINNTLRLFFFFWKNRNIRVTVRKACKSMTE